MHRTVYDPSTQPESSTWLSWPESERLRLAVNFHSVHRLKARNGKAHAAMHVVVENQIASGFGPTVRAMARLQQQGLTRHDALHAVGSVVAEHLHQMMSAEPAADAEPVQRRLNHAIEQLDAPTWLRSLG
jgi:hypothetical protein